MIYKKFKVLFLKIESFVRDRLMMRLNGERIQQLSTPDHAWQHFKPVKPNI
jgi:hypothetical protein